MRLFRIFCQIRWAFCFAFRNFDNKTAGHFWGGRCESILTPDGYQYWKHATEINKGFSKHAVSVEHLASYNTWKKEIQHSEMSKEIDSLDQKKILKEIAATFRYQLIYCCFGHSQVGIQKQKWLIWRRRPFK